MSSVRLNWRDNSGNEDGFRIERRLSGIGDFAQIAEAGVDATSYQDGSVADGSTYDYRVRAFNAAGNSAYSNVASIGPINVVSQPIAARGPQASIVPSGTLIPAGSTTASRQTAINAATTGQAFVLEAGAHTADGSNTPKSGQSFVGQYGAVIDGTGWSSSDPDDAIFRAVNNAILSVVIKNLILTSGPKFGVNAYLTSTDWLIDHCEIADFLTGVSVGIRGSITNNRIHHNTGDAQNSNPALRGGGYALNSALGAQFVNNEVSYNGTEQKFIYGTTNELSQSLYIARNFCHHNEADGLWIDGDGANSIIEDNIVEDNTRSGITIELGVSVMVKNNTIRRSGAEGLLISASKLGTYTGNTLEDNLFGIGLFLDCARLTEGPYPWTVDLANNTIQYNTIRVPNVGGAYGAILTFLPPAACKAPYVANSKNNNFDFNSYTVPGSGNYWGWDGSKSWADWQALVQDANGGRYIAA